MSDPLSILFNFILPKIRRFYIKGQKRRVQAEIVFDTEEEDKIAKKIDKRRVGE
ncbi:MAG: hypothetical protein HeimC3_13950 [Candidatus Heimdallarchaeota archaeon LC_3]|nr:MAG: hypothetical protein HeimC3_13950 [Candidatus Heimdallarchaeota archaeon LC_3]